MQRQKDNLFGILNGVDYTYWDPARDSHLPAKYSPEDLDGKARCKASLIRKLNLDLSMTERPVLGMISRLDAQKGLDLLVQILDDVLELDIGLVVLGFLYNSPVTLAYITKLLLGYWPQWQTNLYWYFLIGGILFVFTVDNKNPYCQWICPFGAAQECMGVIGGARSRGSRRFATVLRWDV